MQKQTFPNGGFVIHKITGAFTGRVSAWFDVDGKLLDAEQILNSNQSRPVKPGGPMWNTIAKLGPSNKN